VRVGEDTRFSVRIVYSGYTADDDGRDGVEQERCGGLAGADDAGSRLLVRVRSLHSHSRWFRLVVVSSSYPFALRKGLDKIPLLRRLFSVVFVFATFVGLPRHRFLRLVLLVCGTWKAE